LIIGAMDDTCECIPALPTNPLRAPPKPTTKINKKQKTQWQGDIWDTDPLRSLFCTFPPPIPMIQQLTVKKAWAQEGRFGSNLYDVTGPTNQMQSAECDGNCFWNSPKFKGTSQDAEFTIEFEQLRAWVDDVKGIFQKDLWRNGTRPERCAVSVFGDGFLVVDDGARWSTLGMMSAL